MSLDKAYLSKHLIQARSQPEAPTLSINFEFNKTGHHTYSQGIASGIPLALKNPYSGVLRSSQVTTEHDAAFGGPKVQFYILLNIIFKCIVTI